MKSLILVSLIWTAQAWAVEPEPKTPSQQKVEEIKTRGGALKVEKKPAKLEPAPMEPMEDQNPEDKAIPPAQKKLKKEKIKTH